MIAREIRVKKCVVSIRNNEFSQKDSVLTAEKLGIDLLVHPEQIAAEARISLIEQIA